MEPEDLRLTADEPCNLEVQQSSGDVDEWENVIFERTPMGSLVIRTLHEDDKIENRLVAEYAPGMWMKWEVTK